MRITHRDIADFANNGEAADAGNLYTFPGAWRYNSGFSASWMPRTMAASLNALADEGIRAEQTIVSFNTPIAMRFYDGSGGLVWIMAETNYSSRTSQQIQKLMGTYCTPGLYGRIERVPFDVTPDELRRIIAGKQRYFPSRTTRHGIGSYVPGPNYVEGE